MFATVFTKITTLPRKFTDNSSGEMEKSSATGGATFEVLKNFMYKIAFMFLLKYEEPLGNSYDNRDKQAM